MRKLLMLIALIVQNTMHAQTYYDTDNKIIDREAFNNVLLDERFYIVENDSLKAFKLMYRNNRDERGFFRRY